MLPRGPLGMASTLATGVISVSAMAMVLIGDLADHLIFATPLGAAAPVLAPECRRTGTAKPPWLPLLFCTPVLRLCCRVGWDGTKPY